MKNNLLSILLLLALSASVYAQEKELITSATNKVDSLRIGWWERSTNVGLNLSGGLFSDNWQGGGVTNFVLGGIFTNRSDYTKGKGVWSNDLQFQVGSVTSFLKDDNGKSSKEMRKNLDRLFFETKYSRTISPKLNWFASANLLSQLLKGNDYGTEGLPLISSFLSPAFISEGVGLEWKPVKHFALSLGGATIRQTLVLSDKVFASSKFTGSESVYGVERGKNIRVEGGFQIVGSYDKNISEKVNLKWRWQTFMPYNIKSFDHNVNAIASIKLNKNVNLNATLIGIYDWDQTGNLKLKPWQLNGGANLGLSFKL